MASRDRTDIAVPLSRRNYLINIINGTLSMVGFRATDGGTVVPLLVLRLTGAEWAVGLVQGVAEAGRVLAQVYASRVLDAVDRKLPTYIFWSVVRILALIGCALACFWGVQSNHNWAVFAVLLAGLTLLAVGHGVSELAWGDITARSMPSTRRGTLWTWRRVTGLLLVIFIAAPVIDFYLGPNSPQPFPANYGVLYLITIFTWGIAWTIFSFTHEPPPHAAKRTLTMRQHLTRGWRIVQRDRSYRRLLRLRVLNSIAGAVPIFFIVFATKTLGKGEEIAAYYLAIRTVSELVASIIFGRISDIHGNRITILLANWCGLLTYLIATVAAIVAPYSTNMSVWLLALAFLALGFFGPARETGEYNYMLDIAPATKRPSYIGFGNAFLMPLSLVPLIVGWAAPQCGYVVIFAFAAIISLIAILISRKLPEPRDDLYNEDNKISVDREFQAVEPEV